MTLLVLGGTGEGRRLSEMLRAEGIDHIASLAGATRAAQAQTGLVRVGGFGGEDGFRRFLDEAGITAVLDATHPFAAQISERTARVATALGLPHLMLLRPAWAPKKGDLWTEIADEAEAREFVQPGQVVFLATGRQTLDRFANLTEARLICRQIDPPDGPFPFANGRFEVGRPPFSVEHEIELFTRLGVDWLITKNAGGRLAEPKLVAARQMGLPVMMIRRPEPPLCARVETVEDAMGWARALA